MQRLSAGMRRRGGIDPLCDDGLRFAAKLRDAGRDVELLHYEGMPHVFSWFPGVSAGPPAVDACAGG